MLRFIRAAGCVVLAMLATAASAQTYPSGPVKLIVPIPAGGVTDVMARVIGQRLQEMWGQAVVVENRPGGNSAVGAQAVERAAADGLTLLVAPDATFSANPALFSKLTYDPDGFTPISVLCRGTPIDRASIAAGEDGGRTDCLRESQSGQAELRLVRHRHVCASEHGRPQAANRHRLAACALSRRGAGIERFSGQ